MSWDSAFTFQSCNIEDSLNSLRERDTEQRSTDSKTIPIDGRIFSLRWERADGVPLTEKNPANVLGLLRSYFPAVIVRTRLLTSSVKTIFCTRYDGRILKEIILAPLP